MTSAVMTLPATSTPPRSIGSLKLVTKQVQHRTGIERFRTSGSMKVAFPRNERAVEAIMVNTSGGLTGGDRFETSATARAGSRLVLTTQAAERAYRSLSGVARVATHLSARAESTLHWLPQEFIVFDGASVARHLTVDLDRSAECVVCEPIVFGRQAMNEVLTTGHFEDRITLRRDGTEIFCDQLRLFGNLGAELAKPAVAGGMTAMATLLYHGKRAEALLPMIRASLPQIGGASILPSGLLAVRLLAVDSFLLRKSLVPILQQLTAHSLPKSWSL